MESQIQPQTLWQWVPEHPLLPHIGNSTGVCSTTHMGDVPLALHWICLILLQNAGMCARSTVHKTHLEFQRNMVMVGAKSKQKITLHITKLPPLCHWVLPYCLHCSSAIRSKHPRHLFNHEKIIWGQECYYTSSSAGELRMERIRTKTRRCPQVGRAEVRHHIQFKHVQTPSTLMYLRVCRKPHYC